MRRCCRRGYLAAVGGGAAVPAFTELTELPAGTTLEDPGGTLTTWTFVNGLWTATANGTSSSNATGFTDGDVGYADVDVLEAEPDWDPATHDLWVRLQIVSSGADDRTFNVALIDTSGAPIGHGFGFVASNPTNPAMGGQLTNLITIQETVAGITDLVGCFSFAGDGNRLVTYPKVGGSYPTNRTSSREFASGSLVPADYALRISTGVRLVNASTDTITARVHTAAVPRPALP